MIDLMPATRRLADLVRAVGDDQLATRRRALTSPSATCSTTSARSPLPSGRPPTRQSRLIPVARLPPPPPTWARTGGIASPGTGRAGRFVGPPGGLGGHDPDRRHGHAWRVGGGRRPGGDRGPRVGPGSGHGPSLRGPRRELEVVVGFFGSFPDEARGDAFGLPAAVPDGATGLDRAVAQAGRDPDWSAVSSSGGGLPKGPIRGI